MKRPICLLESGSSASVEPCGALLSQESQLLTNRLEDNSIANCRAASIVAAGQLGLNIVKEYSCPFVEHSFHTVNGA